MQSLNYWKTLEIKDFLNVTNDQLMTYCVSHCPPQDRAGFQVRHFRFSLGKGGGDGSIKKIFHVLHPQYFLFESVPLFFQF